MKEIANRLQGAGQFSEAQRICADAYEKVDMRDLIEPPGTKLIGIAIVLVGLIVVLFCTIAYLYYDNTNKITASLKKITNDNFAVAAPSNKEGGK
jgi:hypothetical protein